MIWPTEEKFLYKKKIYIKIGILVLLFGPLSITFVDAFNFIVILTDLHFVFSLLILPSFLL